MNGKPQISNAQVKGLIVSTIVGLGILSLPSELSETMGQDAWMVIILAGILKMFMVFIIFKIFDLYEGMEFFQIGEKTLGTILFGISQLIMLAYFIFTSSIISRVLGEVIRGFLLPTTPMELIIFAFILVTAYIARCDIEAIARMGYFTYLLIIIFSLFVVLISIPNAKFTNLLPLFQSDIKQLPKAFKSAYFSFSGLEVLLFIIPYVEEKNKIVKSGLIALIIIIIIYSSITIMALSQFGLEQLKKQNWPTISLLKVVDLPGLFLENLDGIVVASWIFFAFSSLAVSMHMSSKILENLFKAKHHKLFVLPLLPVILFISMTPTNPVEINKSFGKIFHYLSFVAIFIVPVLILIMGFIRKRKGGNEN